MGPWSWGTAFDVARDHQLDDLRGPDCFVPSNDIGLHHVQRVYFLANGEC